MAKMDPIILGVNHMFLYPESMTDGNAHTKSLEKLADSPLVDALDCWVWASHAKEEIEILKSCGKQINYNIGDRFGEAPAIPASADFQQRAWAMNVLRREVDFAVESGAKKLIFSSGADVSENRTDAKARYVDFVLELSQYVPKEICMALEPGDWDIDKHFLLGPLNEAYECVEIWQKEGLNIGILLDMGHIPQLYETLQSAVEKTAPLLKHIHLGNCVLKNPNNPFYGDKHVCWGAEDGEYDENDGTAFIKLLYQAGYFHRGEPQTVSFEMRPLTGMDSEQTLVHLNQWHRKVLAELEDNA